jgi:hypothetical protein
MAGLLDFFQGASNAAASNISAPVDGLAWLLNKAGMDIKNPIGGSDWMRQKGLTAEPKNKFVGLLGESVGGLAPIIAAAKAPQIAKGLLQGAENLAAPQSLNKQAGVYLVAPNKTNPAHLIDVKQKMETLGAPTIRAYWDGEKYIALEGSHRAQAAKELGLTPNIQEMSLKQWMRDHDFPDVKQNASTNRLLDYLSNNSGSKYINFEDLR